MVVCVFFGRFRFSVLRFVVVVFSVRKLCWFILCVGVFGGVWEGIVIFWCGVEMLLC